MSLQRSLSQLCRLRVLELNKQRTLLQTRRLEIRDLEAQLLKLSEFRQEYRIRFCRSSSLSPTVLRESRLFNLRLSQNIGLLEERIKTLQQIEQNQRTTVMSLVREINSLEKGVEKLAKDQLNEINKLSTEQCDEIIRNITRCDSGHLPYI